MDQIGIDEVGRGCLAGPLLVVAARARAVVPNNLDDSKKLTKNRRRELKKELIKVCSFGEGWVSVPEINMLGLTKAMRLGVARALGALMALQSDPIIMDGHINYCETKYMSVKAIIKADSLIPIVSAASIYAKVTRDDFMSQQASNYPGYGFEANVGYGTALHLQAIRDKGILNEFHRLNFAPIKLILGESL